MKKADYYEFLQISPNADQDTIHRVYRFLGARFHPDNPDSGDAEKFSLLKTAYEVLSNPARRSEYDAACKKESPRKAPLSNSIDFMDDLEGETNRRLGVLAVLYFRRRANPVSPEVSLAEIETRMGFPRDYLDFTTWYLQKKGYITKADNSDFTLTVHGVDFVETQRANIPILNKLLARDAETAAEDSVPLKALNAPGIEFQSTVLPEQPRSSAKERRSSAPERRESQPDRRKNSGTVLPPGVLVDRRKNRRDRRTIT